jgi:hypothetical protein
MKIRTFLLGAFAVAVSGCKTYVQPFDDSPLPGRTALTVSGAELEADKGRLVMHVGPTDVGRALGADLAEEPGGVVVTSILKARGTLVEGDQIRSASVSLSEQIDGWSPPWVKALDGASLAELPEKLNEFERAEGAFVLASCDLRAGGERLSVAEVAAVVHLWRIVAAEAIFREKDLGKANDLVYGTLDQLVRAGLVSGANFADFSFSAQPGAREPHFLWWGMAKASTEKGWSFFINQTGFVYASREGFVVDDGAYAMPTGLAEVGAMPRPAQPITPAEIRKRTGVHAVTCVADLQRYVVGLGWVALDLIVERDHRETAVRCKLEDEEENVPVIHMHPGNGAALRGVDFCAVSDLPPDLRPTHARAEDAIVVRIAEGSRAARAGLRPLDAMPATLVVSQPTADEALRESIEAAFGRHAAEPGHCTLDVRSPDGSTRSITLSTAEDRSVAWIPILGIFEDDGARTHFGLGPFDDVVHYSRESVYSPEIDGYLTKSRCSIGTAIGWRSVVGPDGKRSEVFVDPIFDTARLDYFDVWSKAP